MARNIVVGCLLLSVGIVLGVYTFTQETSSNEIPVVAETSSESSDV